MPRITDDDDDDISNQDKDSINLHLLSGADPGPLAPYLAKARWICQSIHPFLDFSRVFYAGVPDAAQEEELDEVDDYTEEEKQAFKFIMRLERGFVSIISTCKNDTRLFLALINKIAEAASASRSDDTTKLKSAILTYIHEDPAHGSRFRDDFEFGLLVPGDPKDKRGFKHLDTAAHLCPLRLKNDFEKDPVGFMDRVEDRIIQITDEDFPSFLYASDRIYDEENEDTGLFRGFLLVRVFRHIFTGPLSAMNPNMKSNKFKAKKFKLTKPTGRTIAYACIQTYIALSSMSQWGSSDNLFNLQDFYNTIIAMFETEPQHTWVVDTLEWWNEQVPGLRPTVSKRKKQTAPNGNERTRPNPFERILAQRERRANAIVGDDHGRQGQQPRVEPGQRVDQPQQPQRRSGQAPHQPPRPVRPVQQGQASRVQSPLRNTTPDADTDIYEEEGEQSNKGGPGSTVDINVAALDSEEEEAADQARRHEAEKRELVGNSGGRQISSALLRRPSLTVVTNSPAVSSHAKAGSSRKRNQEQPAESDLTDLENEQPKKKRPQTSKARTRDAGSSKGKKKR